MHRWYFCVQIFMYMDMYGCVHREEGALGNVAKFPVDPKECCNCLLGKQVSFWSSWDTPSSLHLRDSGWLSRGGKRCITPQGSRSCSYRAFKTTRQGSRRRMRHCLTAKLSSGWGPARDLTSHSWNFFSLPKTDPSVPRWQQTLEPPTPVPNTAFKNQDYLAILGPTRLCTAGILVRVVQICKQLGCTTEAFSERPWLLLFNVCVVQWFQNTLYISFVNFILWYFMNFWTYYKQAFSLDFRGLSVARVHMRWLLTMALVCKQELISSDCFLVDSLRLFIIQGPESTEMVSLLDSQCGCLLCPFLA